MKYRYFFHADTAKYGDRLRHLMIIVTVPLIALCVFCTIQIVLNYRSDVVILLLALIGGSVLAGIIFAFSAVYVAEKHKRRHAHYTFFDILPCGMVFSEYAGEYVHWKGRVILRRLYYIPFGKLESVSRDPKRAPHDITFKGEIRGYFYESGRLGYHVSEDGEVVFDTEMLNLGKFETSAELTVKNRFGNTGRLERSVLYYLEQFRNMPEKKPFNISEYVSRRSKPKPTTSNPALEAPSFNRNWK
ncbi:MAG: hypothetical protein K2N38_12905 [Oscillospiraceae bacterium]|nr:hypothetical protein [Oscillospiraceae bacterium]